MLSQSSRETAPARGDPSALLIQWAAHGQSAAIQHVGVDHRRLDILVTEQFLHSADVVVGLQQVCSKGMAKRMRADGLDDLGQARRLANGFLQTAFVQVVAMRAA